MAGEEHALKEGQDPRCRRRGERAVQDTFKPGEWVQVPESKIKGTSVQKYACWPASTMPGPDLERPAPGGRRAVPTARRNLRQDPEDVEGQQDRALRPSTNNIMSNFVATDWHDVSAGHVQKALRILLGALERDGTGAIGRAGNLAARLGIGDREAAQAILTRYQDSGGSIGGWLTQEIANDQLEPIVEALKAEIRPEGADAGGGEVRVYSALQHLLHARSAQPGKPRRVEARPGHRHRGEEPAGAVLERG